MSIGLLGQKIGMTSVYDASGKLRPVTVIAAGDNVLVSRINADRNGYSAVKVAFGTQKVIPREDNVRLSGDETTD